MTRRLLVVALALAGVMVLGLMPAGADVGSQWDGMRAVASRHSASHHFVDATNMMGRGRVVGSRPAGCPRRYCGCASARKLGLSNRDGRLNLAANWLRFPRAHPAPGMAAARRGHVFVILRVTGPGRVLAYDPNSGRGLTRIHERRLAGFTVVNPRVHVAGLR